MRTIWHFIWIVPLVLIYTIYLIALSIYCLSVHDAIELERHTVLR